MGIIDNAKEVAELVRKYNDLDLYDKIVDLRDEIFNLKEENISLKEKNKELEEAFKIKGNIEREGNVYFLVESDGNKRGPFCLTCWDDDRKLINVTKERVSGKYVFICGRCNKLRQR